AAALENLLRRLPRVIHELRWRHGERPPFRVSDIHDLEDLLRALLPLQFDDVRPLCRTPSYAAATRTDFLLVSPVGGRSIALTPKWLTPELAERGCIPVVAASGGPGPINRAHHSVVAPRG